MDHILIILHGTIKRKINVQKSFQNNFVIPQNLKKNGFPKYRRRDNKNFGHIYNQKFNGDFITIDNSMVVPYNPEIVKKYKCHISVKYCASIMSIKYVYKYLHKGHDRAFVKI